MWYHRVVGGLGNFILESDRWRLKFQLYCQQQGQLSLPWSTEPQPSPPLNGDTNTFLTNLLEELSFKCMKWA